jgi:hypothetical protein
VQVLGKDAIRGKVITDAEKRRITIEVPDSLLRLSHLNAIECAGYPDMCRRF